MLLPLLHHRERHRTLHRLRLVGFGRDGRPPEGLAHRRSHQLGRRDWRRFVLGSAAHQRARRREGTWRAVGCEAAHAEAVQAKRGQVALRRRGCLQRAAPRRRAPRPGRAAVALVLVLLSPLKLIHAVLLRLRCFAPYRLPFDGGAAGTALEENHLKVSAVARAAAAAAAATTTTAASAAELAALERGDASLCSCESLLDSRLGAPLRRELLSRDRARRRRLGHLARLDGRRLGARVGLVGVHAEVELPLAHLLRLPGGVGLGLPHVALQTADGRAQLGVLRLGAPPLLAARALHRARQRRRMVLLRLTQRRVDRRRHRRRAAARPAGAGAAAATAEHPAQPAATRRRRRRRLLVVVGGRLELGDGETDGVGARRLHRRRALLPRARHDPRHLLRVARLRRGARLPRRLLRRRLERLGVLRLEARLGDAPRLGRTRRAPRRRRVLRRRLLQLMLRLKPIAQGAKRRRPPRLRLRLHLRAPRRARRLRPRRLRRDRRRRRRRHRRVAILLRQPRRRRKRLAAARGGAARAFLDGRAQHLLAYLRRALVRRQARLGRRPLGRRAQLLGVLLCQPRLHLARRRRARARLGLGDSALAHCLRATLHARLRRRDRRHHRHPLRLRPRAAAARRELLLALLRPLLLGLRHRLRHTQPHRRVVRRRRLRLARRRRRALVVARRVRRLGRRLVARARRTVRLGRHRHARLLACRHRRRLRRRRRRLLGRRHRCCRRTLRGILGRLRVPDVVRSHLVTRRGDGAAPLLGRALPRLLERRRRLLEVTHLHLRAARLRRGTALAIPRRTRRLELLPRLLARRLERRLLLALLLLPERRERTLALGARRRTQLVGGVAPRRLRRALLRPPRILVLLGQLALQLLLGRSLARLPLLPQRRLDRRLLYRRRATLGRGEAIGVHL